MAALMHFAKKAEAEPGSIVEIGSFRGVTAALLAGQTERKLYAVDPFGEYGGGEGDLAIFRSRTSEFPNITHIRAPSGVAATAWNNGPINFLFVDAVHDYVNTIFDSTAWSRHLVPNGYLAMHDVDNGGYPGTRLAAAQMAKRMKLACHIPDLIILQKA
jgi:predicted O-methyltransferase YrrM